MMYGCIDRLQQKAGAVAALCRLLEVSRSGYYAARRRASQPARACPVTTRLRAAFAASGRSYGSRRLRLDLHARGLPVGRFFLNLKMERVWQRDNANHAEATRDVADYIVGFYHNVRLHSILGYLPPNAYELKSAAKQPIDMSEIT
jgi:transposase InsO family protein